jgi:hypothetical protein
MNVMMVVINVGGIQHVMMPLDHILVLVMKDTRKIIMIVVKVSNIS